MKTNHFLGRHRGAKQNPRTKRVVQPLDCWFLSAQMEIKQLAASPFNENVNWILFTIIFVRKRRIDARGAIMNVERLTELVSLTSRDMLKLIFSLDVTSDDGDENVNYHICLLIVTTINISEILCWFWGRDLSSLNSQEWETSEFLYFVSK